MDVEEEPHTHPPRPVTRAGASPDRRGDVRSLPTNLLVIAVHTA